MTIQVFRTVNGEDIIANVKGEDANEYSLEEPAVLLMQQGTGDKVGFAIAPYIPYAVGLVKLQKRAVAAIIEPDPGISQQYNRLYGSGIEIAPASVLAGLK